MTSFYDSWSDFVADDSFRRWVLRPTTGDVARWEAYIRQHPHQADMIEQAIRTVRQLAEATAPAQTDVDEEEWLWQQIQQRIDAGESARVVSFRPLRWLSVAAAACVLVTVGWWLMKPATDSVNAVYQPPLAQTSVLMQKRLNTGQKPLRLQLADGTSVALEPNSELTYPAAFSDESRVVFLTGEAFFEVQKRPQQPFLVYAGQTVTRVLGTSFRIKANPNDPTVQVVVRTGKVSVYARSTAGVPDTKAWRAVQLTPNQQAVFITRTAQLRRELVPMPEPLPVAAPVTELVFDDRPVTEVLDRLEAIYGLKIDYDRATLANCTITTTFTNESLIKRLSFICQAIGATYSVTDGQIRIESPGC